MTRISNTVLAAAVAFTLASPTLGAGNLAANGVDLPELKIDTENLAYSQTEYQLETGKYYSLTVTSDGSDEIAWFAPELWRNSWINQVVINDLEVKAFGLYSLEFDDAGSIEVTFVVLRPGEYDFYSPGYESRGLKGKFVVQ